ncbi:Cof-type HAD-IIB family hydrolase [Lactiplantibacillus sp. WILCCON 0030]|uniref:Cof-type HAD-IIB family hydrolase n=1 Tax=Lactiplantibacillus brownii TaxID=3069269 RepID=A0ABU1A5Y6_9LACO|nr:Cof-type HAD-IIB family hydrolase [Lactiplantibacillus brownii]MDQ7936379.1 Cof-type HAD-IIB family hydrolase [Lactiplantibacillus brownii]
MSIKLIALDIDDTLLDSTGKLLASTKAAVKKALAQGIKIVLCTGRPLAGVQPYLDALQLTGDEQYVITYNGAVTESVSGHVVAKHLVDNAMYRKMTAFGQAHQVPFNVLDEESNIYTADRDVNWVTVIQAWENKAGVLVRDPDDLPADFQITKGLFVGDEAQLDALEPLVDQTFGKDCYIVRAGSVFLELMNPVVNKGQALKDLAQVLDLSADEVMAVGDEKNDIPMFKFAGTAVAMGNGSDAAKAVVDYVTGTNDEGGLADAIQKLALI